MDIERDILGGYDELLDLLRKSFLQKKTDYINLELAYEESQDRLQPDRRPSSEVVRMLLLAFLPGSRLASGRFVNPPHWTGVVWSVVSLSSQHCRAI